MNLKQIQELIKFVAKSGATEVDLEMGDVKICIKSPPKGKITSDISSNFVIPQAPVAQAPVAHNTNLSHGNDVTTSSDTSIDNADSSHIIIKSPIIGTFYRKPSPDKEPFVKIGDNIKKGDVICIIEAMKMMNEIKSDFEGKVAAIEINDGQPVEYGQTIFIIQ